ncbi:hypothetical protein H0H81_012347 [Sphagnurus paluster]|uniref:Protein kinase domain-containing protein n=1 Tax=Sphagnurus paluster TaxID=117069 RepID=A0A9P7GN84_9AGAR|nr:hypothetical protein H0H81_012347 [Sphagnurus paluster]
MVASQIIQQLLNLQPAPGLAFAFSIFRFIWDTVQQVKDSERQLTILVDTIAQFLCTLNDQFYTKKLSESRSAKSLDDLRSLLQDISQFASEQRRHNFLKSLYVKDERVDRIRGYHQKIATLVASFQISALVDLRAFQNLNEEARIQDQQLLNERLGNLQGNFDELRRVLDSRDDNIIAMMASLASRIQRKGDDREHQFYQYSLQYLSTLSGRYVELHDWTVTSYDVDFGIEIGSGGFSKVFKEFLGANILDERPFIVMPYYGNGNVRQYIERHPHCDRVQIIYDVALGIAHLHEKMIVHGDLKGMNVLIDDNGHGVICDFGLTQVKADVTSRTGLVGGVTVVGSRNWMAPELLQGQSLRKPCDIYAFGMLIYEVRISNLRTTYQPRPADLRE